MMKISRSIANFLPAIALFNTPFLSAPVVFAETDFNKVEIQTIPITNNLYMLIGEGGNMGVSVGEDGIFLIDDQFAPLTDKIKAAIGEISDQPIRFLINTHWHFDHTGGNENLGKEGVIIIAHDNVRKQMTVDQFLETFNMNIPASPKGALPIITFNDSTTFYLNNQTIHTFHVEPAHTDGDSVIHFIEANVIHTGDIYFQGMYPFIDLSTGGSIDGMIAGVDRILSLCDDQTKIIPGHGALSNQQELIAYKNMLITVKERVKIGIEQGKTLEAFLASKPTNDLDEIWGKGFLTPEQFLTIVYQDLSR